MFKTFGVRISGVTCLVSGRWCQDVTDQLDTLLIPDDKQRKPTMDIRLVLFSFWQIYVTCWG